MKDKEPFLFGKKNYILMAIGLFLVLIGFTLMITNNSDPNSFNPEVFDAQRLSVAPTLIILGFLLEFIAIFKK